MEGLVSGLLEGVLCTIFSKEAMLNYLKRQRSLHTLAQHLMAQLPPGVSHAELRWRMTEECRPDVIEETLHPESPVGLCWAKVREYIYLVLIFFKLSMVERSSRL